MGLVLSTEIADPVPAFFLDIAGDISHKVNIWILLVYLFNRQGYEFGVGNDDIGFFVFDKVLCNRNRGVRPDTFLVNVGEPGILFIKPLTGGMKRTAPGCTGNGRKMLHG